MDAAEVVSADTAGAEFATDRRNIDIQTAWKIGRKHAEDAAGHRAESNEWLYKALQSTLDLYHLAKESDENADQLQRLFKQHEIRRTKRTPEFTPLVKLVFVTSDDHSNINRYAGVLRFALANEVRPEGLPDFIKDKGGIAKCAILEIKSRRGNTSDTAPQFEKPAPQIENQFAGYS